MSHGVTTEAVPHIVHIAGDGYGDLKPWHILMLDRDQYAEQEAERIYTESDGKIDQDVDPGDEAELEGSGWKVSRKVAGEGGWEHEKFGFVYATIVRKGEHVVYAINSSQYNNVGEYRVTVIAKVEEALIEFLADLAGECMMGITSPGVAEQWG